MKNVLFSLFLCFLCYRRDGGVENMGLIDVPLNGNFTRFMIHELIIELILIIYYRLRGDGDDDDGGDNISQ
jgi:hypothetical protein